MSLVYAFIALVFASLSVVSAIKSFRSAKLVIKYADERAEAYNAKITKLIEAIHRLEEFIEKDEKSGGF